MRRAVSVLAAAAILAGAVGWASSSPRQPAARGAPTTSRRVPTVALRPDNGVMAVARIPAGWHRVWRAITPLIDPIPRLVVASFAVRLARHTCVCDLPAIRDFPKGGTLLIVWEYGRLTAGGLRHFPPRPSAFHIPAVRYGTHQCAGPSYELLFSIGRRAFQADMYIGATAGRGVRARLAAVLDSLRLAPA
ncbi:MAG: hypothetical protein ACRDNK_07000 [Solirubrobacteraceae bacterium]